MKLKLKLCTFRTYVISFITMYNRYELVLFFAHSKSLKTQIYIYKERNENGHNGSAW